MPIHTNMALHQLATKNFTFPIPATTKKQPKPKKQKGSQPKDGTGRLRSHPSPQRKKLTQSKIGVSLRLFFKKATR
jgi:hypothetical protein